MLHLLSVGQDSDPDRQLIYISKFVRVQENQAQRFQRLATGVPIISLQTPRVAFDLQSL
jgi:hypothetical protein